jgi:electron transfer flavoprotein alpha subunit
MTTLLIAESQGGALCGQTARALRAASALSGEVHVLVAGQDVATAAEAAAGLSGVSKVMLADSPVLAHGLAEPLADLIVSLAGPYDAIVMAATTGGKNVMPRVAGLLDMAQISDIVAVIDDRTFKRSIYAGNAIATVASSDARRIITVRSAAFPPAEAGIGSAPVERVAFTGVNTLSRFVSAQVPESDRPDLSAARVVVSGGRAFGSKENFDGLLNPVAAKLHAAIGARWARPGGS